MGYSVSHLFALYTTFRWHLLTRDMIDRGTDSIFWLEQFLNDGIVDAKMVAMPFSFLQFIYCLCAYIIIRP